MSENAKSSKLRLTAIFVAVALMSSAFLIGIGGFEDDETNGGLSAAAPVATVELDLSDGGILVSWDGVAANYVVTQNTNTKDIGKDGTLKISQTGETTTNLITVNSEIGTADVPFNVIIDGVNIEIDGSGAPMELLGYVNLYLIGENAVKNEYSLGPMTSAGILTENGLTILDGGNGELNVTQKTVGNHHINGAGIGGMDLNDLRDGIVTIESGKVSVYMITEGTGMINGAGIGGGQGGDGTVKINGGEVYVSMSTVGAGAHISSAGIGGGYENIAKGPHGVGNVIITDGKVTVEMKTGASDVYIAGAGIGGGLTEYPPNEDDIIKGNVTIGAEGKVPEVIVNIEMNGSQYAPGIGSGANGSGIVTIESGIVSVHIDNESDSPKYGSVIGGGNGGNGTVTINGGTITTYRPGMGYTVSKEIGGGNIGDSNVTINGGSIRLTDPNDMSAWTYAVGTVNSDGDRVYVLPLEIGDNAKSGTPEKVKVKIGDNYAEIWPVGGFHSDDDGNLYIFVLAEVVDYEVTVEMDNGDKVVCAFETDDTGIIEGFVDYTFVEKPNDGGGGNDWLLYGAIIAVVAIVALLAVYFLVLKKR